MPAVIAISTILDIIMIAHVLRTGRDRYWVYIILAIPIGGAGIYFLLEFFPEFRRSRIGKKATTHVRNAIDPDYELKRLAKDLATSNNTQNKLRLADECNHRGLHQEAVQLYEGCLTGMYKTDPNIMLKLATALFHQQGYAKAKQTLDELIAANPDYKSPEGHLLYARTLEALEETEQALEEYSVLADYYTGLEAKCRYALLLKKQGHTEKAEALFKEIIDKVIDMPSYYRKDNKTWLEIAKQQL